MRRSRRLAVLAVTAAIMAGGAGAAMAAPSLPLPIPGVPGVEEAGDASECEMTRTDEYQRSNPEAVGLDAAKLQAAIAYWNSTGSESLKVFRHGCLVGEGATEKVFERVPRLNWSQTKTVSALIAGVAAKQGLIRVDDPVGEYLPEGLGDEAHRAITIRSILNMTTGARINYVRGLNLVGDISRPREVMSADLPHKPGEYFEYDQTTPSLLNYVVQQAIEKREPGLDYQAWAQREFWNKLGIPESAYWWQRDRAGNTLGYSQLFLRPLEFGRLGELMMHEGTYAGEEIIDPGYIKELSSGSEANCGYGFMIWRNGCDPDEKQVNGSLFKRAEIQPGQPWIASAPKDMYWSWGLHGQHTFVIPSLDMVITRSGEQPPDTQSGLTRLDGDAPIAGNPGKIGYFTFFKMVMDSVEDMPADVRATLSDDPGNHVDPEFSVDPDTFLYPVDTAPGTYLALGPQAPEGCTVAGCEQEPNDGLKWITDVPRTVPGVVGAEERPNG